MRLGGGRRSRRRGMFLIGVLTVMLCLLPSNLVFALNADDEIAKIQKAYENITDVSGGFTQKSLIKELKRTDTYKGRFFIKARKMKWEYGGTSPQSVYIAGADIVIYQKNEKQAFRSRFDSNTYGQAPIALLAGLGDIRQEFDVSAKGEHILLLKPKRPMANISYVELVPSKGEFPIESLTIVDALSNRVDIQLSDVRINTGLDDGIFKFSPLAGVNVFQQ
jgi:outer membrane lipoprotein carrier protein